MYVCVCVCVCIYIYIYVTLGITSYVKLKTQAVKCVAACTDA